jgi:hypothetical protein
MGPLCSTVPREKKAYRRRILSRPSASSRRYAPLHVLLQNLLPTNDASPCRNVPHNGRRLEAASSYPRTTVRGLVPASLGKPKLFKFERIGLCVWATGAHGQISGHEGAPAVFGTNLRVAHGEPSSWLVWTDKGPLRMSGTHRPWVACGDAAGSAEARTLS